MKRRLLVIILVVLSTTFVLLFFFWQQKKSSPSSETAQSSEQTPTSSITDPYAPLTIQALKNRSYPVSDIKIEETLTSGVGFKRYIASYLSDGLKIYGLFTIPNTAQPSGGFPAIVFLHGFLDPATYQTTDRYIAYQEGFAKNGFVTFKPDLRGHGKSEGEPVNSNFSQDYVIDTLNLVAALKSNRDINPKLIGMWGHSNGGGITLRALEVSKDIKTAVIWAGVVGSYEDLLSTHRAKIPWINDRLQLSTTAQLTSGSIPYLIQKYGLPDLKSPFWSQIDPYTYLQDITAPVQLHHGSNDKSVPIELSTHFRDQLTAAGKVVEYHEYTGGDHNLASPAFSVAMARSIAFFQKYLY